MVAYLIMFKAVYFWIQHLLCNSGAIVEKFVNLIYNQEVFLSVGQLGSLGQVMGFLNYSLQLKSQLFHIVVAPYQSIFCLVFLLFSLYHPE